MFLLLHSYEKRLYWCCHRPENTSISNGAQMSKLPLVLQRNLVCPLWPLFAPSPHPFPTLQPHTITAVQFPLRFCCCGTEQREPSVESSKLTLTLEGKNIPVEKWNIRVFQNDTQFVDTAVWSQPLCVCVYVCLFIDGSMNEGEQLGVCVCVCV